LHPVREGEAYCLGVSQVRAYQEPLGDLHNPTDDTPTVGVRINEDGSFNFVKEIRETGRQGRSNHARGTPGRAGGALGQPAGLPLIPEGEPGRTLEDESCGSGLGVTGIAYSGNLSGIRFGVSAKNVLAWSKTQWQTY